MKNSLFYILAIIILGELFLCCQSRAITDEEFNKLVANLGTRHWQAAVDSLAAFGEPAVAPLIALMQTENESLELQADRASYVLAQIKTPEAIQLVGHIALDSTASIRRRRYAIEALGSGKIAESTNLLVTLLHDENRYIADPAARSLGAIATPTAVSALVDILSARPHYVSVPDIRRALTTDHADLAVQTSIQSLNSERYWTWLGVYQGLIETGEIAVPTLLKHINHADFLTRLRIIRALGTIGSRKAAPELTNALADPDWMIRNEAAVALAKIGADTIHSQLKTMQQDENLAYARDDITWLLSRL